MSKYTTELRYVIKQFGRDVVESWFKDYELADYLTADEIKVINDRGCWSKDKLAKKIVNHYLMREIGFETPALFRENVKIFMNELMEEKLPLIYSQSIIYDPLINVDYVETYTREIVDEGESNGESNSNGSGLSVNSDTPQGQISKASILGGSYASNTNAQENTARTTDTTNTSSQSNEDSTKRVRGNSGVSATAQKMIEQYRDNIVSIDRGIIRECNILFFGLY